MRQRLFCTVAAAVMVFGAALTTSLRASPPAATAVPPTGSGWSRAVASENNYVGPGSCSAVACHGAIRRVPGARILQTEYSTWVSQDRHAPAAEGLANPAPHRSGPSRR